MTARTRRRSGAATVEAAFAVPVALILIFGILIGALGVFRYQQVAYLAREGARFACVRGTQYALNTQRPAATPDEVYNTVIKPRLVMLEESAVTYSVTWNTDKRPGSMVIVRVNYNWEPGFLFGASVPLSSTASMPMSY